MVDVERAQNKNKRPFNNKANFVRQIPNLPLLNRFFGWKVFDLRSMAIEISIT